MTTVSTANTVSARTITSRPGPALAAPGSHIKIHYGAQAIKVLVAIHVGPVLQRPGGCKLAAGRSR